MFRNVTRPMWLNTSPIRRRSARNLSRRAVTSAWRRPPSRSRWRSAGLLLSRHATPTSTATRRPSARPCTSQSAGQNMRNTRWEIEMVYVSDLRFSFFSRWMTMCPNARRWMRKSATRVGSASPGPRRCVRLSALKWWRRPPSLAVTRCRGQCVIQPTVRSRR